MVNIALPKVQLEYSSWLEWDKLEQTKGNPGPRTESRDVSLMASKPKAGTDYHKSFCLPKKPWQGTGGLLLNETPTWSSKCESSECGFFKETATSHKNWSGIGEKHCPGFGWD